MRNRRRGLVAGAGVALVVVVLAVVGWTWLRPAWQTHGVVSDLRAIDGVSSVSEPDDEDRPDTFAVALDPDAEPKAVSKAASEVRAVMDGRRIRGDEVQVTISLDGFELEDAGRRLVDENLVRAVQALGGVEGVSGVSANDAFVDFVAAPGEVLPRAVAAVKSLAAADLYSRASLRVQPRGNGPTVSVSIAGAEDAVAPLEKLARVLDTADVELTTGSNGGVRVYGSGDDVECTAEVRIEDSNRLREVAAAFAPAGDLCRTRITTAEDDRLFTVASGAPGVKAGLDLLDRLERTGLTSVGVSSDMLSMSGVVTDGDELLALRDLTTSDAWPLDDEAALTLAWQDTGTAALKLKKAAVLQRFGAGLASLRDAGYVPSMFLQTKDGDRSITVKNEEGAASDLSTTDGRKALVDAVRTSGLPGDITFTVFNRQVYNGVSFSSTVTGPASDVELPSQGNTVGGESPKGWAEDLMAQWESTARG